MCFCINSFRHFDISSLLPPLLSSSIPSLLSSSEQSCLVVSWFRLVCWCDLLQISLSGFVRSPSGFVSHSFSLRKTRNRDFSVCKRQTLIKLSIVHKTICGSEFIFKL